MFADWNKLSDDQQLSISDAAMAKAAQIYAIRAERLAEEIETGSISDLGGPDALRLFAQLIRINGRNFHTPQGNA